MNNDQLQKPLRYAIIIAVFFALGGLIYAATTMIGNTLNQSAPQAYNASLPDYTDGSLRYYNGNTFVSYNQSSRNITALSAHKMITNVSSAVWGKNGVVFVVNQIDQTSDLWSLYSKIDNYTSVSPYSLVWYLSLKDNSLHLLAQNSYSDSFAVAANNGSVLYRLTPTSYGLIDTDGNITQTYVAIPENSRVLRVTDNSVFTATVIDKTKLNIGRVTLSDNSTQSLGDLTSNSSGLSLLDSTITMPSDTIVYGVTSSKLVAFDLNTKKTKVLLQGFSGKLYSTHNQTYAIALRKTNYLISVIDGMSITKTYRVDNGQTIAQNVFETAPDNFIIFSATQRMFVVSKNTSNLPKAFSDALDKRVSDLPTSMSLSRQILNPSDNAYLVTIYSGNISKNLDQLWDAIKKAGLNPNEFTFSIQVGPDASY